MKERSITLRTHDVQAILAGRKTMHRVPLGTQPVPELSVYFGGWDYPLTKAQSKKQNDADLLWLTNPAFSKFLLDESPFQIGDTLYVKETFQVTGWNYDHGYFVITYADGERQQVEGFEDDQRNFKWIEQCGVDATKAGRDLDENDNFVSCEREDFRNRSSMHMPRQAARIFLRITDVRVERLQDISEEDAKAQGVERLEYGYADYMHNYKDGPKEVSAKQSFKSLCQSTRSTKSWMANPWVWVISWEVINKPQ